LIEPETGGAFRDLVPKKKPPEGGFLNSILTIDQANLNASFDLRRYAMKPTPAKPKIIMAHVEGSGTGGVENGTPFGPS
jgi:hypothetical protein